MFRASRFLIAVAVLPYTFVGLAVADEQSTAAPIKRSIFSVRNGTAEDLANVVSQHFKDAADVRIVVESATNSLLISGQSVNCDAVVETMKQLDCTRRSISIEVIVVEVPPAGDNARTANESAIAFDERELAGPVDRVNERLQALLKSSQIVNVQRMRVETLDQQVAQSQSSAEKSIINGVAVNQRTGLGTPILQRRSVGTIVQVTPRITVRDEVLLDLTVRDDRVFVPAEPRVIGKDENGPIVAPEILSSNVVTKMVVAPGRAAIVQGVQTVDIATERVLPEKPEAAPAATPELPLKTSRFIVIVAVRLGESTTGQ